MGFPLTVSTRPSKDFPYISYFEHTNRHTVCVGSLGFFFFIEIVPALLEVKRRLYMFS